MGEEIKHLQPQLTQGSLAHSLITFAIPILFANILQTLYGTADLIIIGQFSEDTSALAAVSNASQIIGFITVFISGFSSSGMVLIGQYLGSRQYEGIKKVTGTIFCFFPLLGALLSVLSIVFAPWFLQAINVPREALPAAQNYIRICGGGLLAATGYNMFSAVLRGLGDSKNPLIIVAMSCAINILGDLLLVGFFHMGPAGAACATVAAQSISVFFAYSRLKLICGPEAVSLRHVKIDRSVLSCLIRLGLPIAAEGLLVNLSFMLITAMINRFGLVAASSIGIVEKIGAIVRLPAVSFSAAVSAMAAQNIGANNVRRAKQVMYMGIWISLLISLFTFSAMCFAPDVIMRMYTQDVDIIAAGCEYMHSFSYDTLLVCVTFCMAGFFTGSGKGLFTFIRNMISTVFVRIPLAYYFSHTTVLNMFRIGLAAPIASAASIIIGVLYLRFGFNKK